MNQENGSSLDFLGILAILYKHRKFSVLVVSVGFVLSVASTFLVARKYESEATIYPANIKTVSSEDPTEQIVQVLGSSEIKQKLIDSFQLVTHYGFDPEDYKRASLFKKLASRYEVEQTPYSSVIIRVLDESPLLASDMVNAAILFMNQKISKMNKAKSMEWAVFSQNRYEEKRNEIEVLSTELRKMQEDYDLVSYEDQASAVALAFSKLKSKRKMLESKKRLLEKLGSAKFKDSLTLTRIKLDATKATLKSTKSRLDSIISVGNKISDLSAKLDLGREYLLEYKSEYELALQQAKKKITYSHVVSAPNASDKSKYPNRILAAVLGLVGSIILTILLIVGKETWPGLKQRLFEQA